MNSFKEGLTLNEEGLLQRLYQFSLFETDNTDKVEEIGKRLNLHRAQFICAIGFNKAIRALPELPPILGFETYDALVQARNKYFTTDIYQLLSLNHIQLIYSVVKDDPQNRHIMEYLLPIRLSTIEKYIEKTVNAIIIKRYKKEISIIYFDKIASIDFVEKRLAQSDSGFRILLNEIALILESKTMAANDIFFRNSISPQEKKKLLDKNLIPRKLIEARLRDPKITMMEKEILYDHMQSHYDQ